MSEFVHGYLQSLSAGTPTELTAMIRQIKVPLDVVSITADGGTYTCFFMCRWTIKQSGEQGREIQDS